MASNSAHVRLERATLDKLDVIIKAKKENDQMTRSYPSAIAEIVNAELERVKG